MVDWVRPDENSKDNDVDDMNNQCMIKDGMRPGDVKQGILGDCYFLGALLVFATRPELLQNLIVYDGIKSGFAAFQFFKNGKWEGVVIDTRIPFNKDTKLPLYAKCADANEYWVPLLEKAYAKIHGSYEAIDGGSMAQALVDLTGGISEKIYLETPEVKEMIEDGQLWKDLKKYRQQKFLLGCAKSVKDQDGNQEEEVMNSGIIANHAFGIEDIREAQGQQMLKVRNPWGHSGWSGRFSYDDEAWDEYKGLKEELGYTQNSDDGCWWMTFSDFHASFNKIYVCKIFPPTWQQYSITDSWEDKTAGGPYPPMIDRDEEDVDSRIKNDTNEKWFNNPQYRISVEKKTTVYISLMQEDEKISKRAYIPVNFLLVRVHSKKDRLWEVDRDDIVLEAATGGQVFAQREITKTVKLYPTYNKRKVHYILVPNTVGESKKDEERPFILRIFASETMEFVKLPNTIDQSFVGKWSQTTAGGKRTNESGQENQKWCINPQYFLNITQPTHLKIILKRKKGGKRMKSQMGLCVTKSQSPIKSPAAQMIKEPKGNKFTKTKVLKKGE